MTLREMAEADSTMILEDTSGFGTTIRMTAPDGKVFILRGEFKRIGVQPDPASGLIVMGNSAAITVSLSSLVIQGLGDIETLYDDNWQAEVSDITGKQMVYRCYTPMLDRVSGRLTMTMKAFDV